MLTFNRGNERLVVHWYRSSPTRFDESGVDRIWTVQISEQCDMLSVIWLSLAWNFKTVKQIRRYGGQFVNFSDAFLCHRFQLSWTLFDTEWLINACYTRQGCPLSNFKPKVMKTPNVVCQLVFTNIFRKTGFELMTSLWWHHDHI